MVVASDSWDYGGGLANTTDPRNVSELRFTDLTRWYIAGR